MRVETNPSGLAEDMVSVLGPEYENEIEKMAAITKMQRGPQTNGFDTFNADTATTKEKGNYGEYKSAQNLINNQSLKDAGYDLKPIGRPAPTSLKDKIVKGIDGIYENKDPNSPIKFIIDEAKFGTSALSTTKNHIKQMSDPWLKGQSRILKAIAKDKEGLSLEERKKLEKEEYKLANKIINAIQMNQVERVLSKIDSDGNVTTYKLDSQGKIIGTWP